jgi:hypothetical protein
MSSVHWQPKVDVQREELVVIPAASLYGAADGKKTCRR